MLSNVAAQHASPTESTRLPGQAESHETAGQSARQHPSAGHGVLDPQSTATASNIAHNPTDQNVHRALRSRSPQHVVDSLYEAFLTRRACLLIGAGVSASVAANRECQRLVTWKGFLRALAKLVMERLHLDPSWYEQIENMLSTVRSSEVGSLGSSAQVVAKPSTTTFAAASTGPQPAIYGVNGTATGTATNSDNNINNITTNNNSSSSSSIENAPDIVSASLNTALDDHKDDSAITFPKQNESNTNHHQQQEQQQNLGEQQQQQPDNVQQQQQQQRKRPYCNHACANCRSKLLGTGSNSVALDKAAEMIEHYINTGHNGGSTDPFMRYHHLVFKILHKLRANKDAPLAHALDRLNAPIFTTNYDVLLEDATGRFTLSIDDLLKAQRMYRMKPEIHPLQLHQQYVFHLHGVYYDDPERKFVLTAREYAVTIDDFIMALRPVLIDTGSRDMTGGRAFHRSLVFVGTGGTLQDVHFASLFATLYEHNTYLESNGYSRIYHYVLVSEKEKELVTHFCFEDSLGQQVHSSELLIPVVYGDDYEDLPPFLIQLGDRLETDDPSAANMRSSMVSYEHGGHPERHATNASAINSSFATHTTYGSTQNFNQGGTGGAGGGGDSVFGSGQDYISEDNRGKWSSVDTDSSVSALDQEGTYLRDASIGCYQQNPGLSLSDPSMRSSQQSKQNRNRQGSSSGLQMTVPRTEMIPTQASVLLGRKSLDSPSLLMGRSQSITSNPSSSNIGERSSSDMHRALFTKVDHHGDLSSSDSNKQSQVPRPRVTTTPTTISAITAGMLLGSQESRSVLHQSSNTSSMIVSTPFSSMDDGGSSSQVVSNGDNTVSYVDGNGGPRHPTHYMNGGMTVPISMNGGCNVEGGYCVNCGGKGYSSSCAAAQGSPYSGMPPGSLSNTRTPTPTSSKHYLFIDKNNMRPDNGSSSSPFRAGRTK